MKENKTISKREKSAAVGLVICFVAMIAIVGMVTFGRHEKRTETELAKAEQEQKTETQQIPEQKEEDTQPTNGQQVESQIQSQAEDEIPVEVVDAPVLEQHTFSAADTLVWPVEGNVLLSYSMDQTIYFSTLDQYKYNPALVISGELGAPVIAAAAGKVTTIQETAQTGTTVTMELGNGYEAIYGQLKDLKVQEGVHVMQGESIGVVGEPSRYYSVEGPNVYFQLLKNGEPVNPLEYFAE